MKWKFLDRIPKWFWYVNGICLLTSILLIVLGFSAVQDLWFPGVILLILLVIADTALLLCLKDNSAVKQASAAPAGSGKRSSARPGQPYRPSAPVRKAQAPDQPTLALPKWVSKGRTPLYLFLAFLIPFLLMYIPFKFMGVTPYGNNMILATDLYHQYYPFLVDYHEKLRSGGSLLWTWTTGGGANYLALMAYYTASPLNLLSLLFPTDMLGQFVYYLTCTKIGLAGLFFALFLRITFKRSDISITAFGVMYALCAFVTGYYWNIIWLDTFALLPLVVAGTIALLREGKYRLYIIALALSIIANYYIALFVCIFVVFVSVGYTLVEFKSWRKTLRDFFKMVGCTVVSFMISAVLILPTYYAMQYTYNSSTGFPQEFAVNMGGTPDFAGVLMCFGKTISNTLAAVEPTTRDQTLPNVYCGVFAVFLAILFLFCSKIKKRERFYCLGLVIFLMLSFAVRQLDYIWHGFHFPNMLYFRFSFLLSFVLLYMAFRVFMYIDSIKPISVIAGICCFIFYLFVASRYYFDDGGAKLADLFSVADPNPIVLSGFLGLLIGAWLLLYSFRSYLQPYMQAIGVGVIGIATTIFVVNYAETFMTPLRKDHKEVHDNTTFQVIVIIIFTILFSAIALSLLSKQFKLRGHVLRFAISGVLILLAITEGAFSAAIGINAVGVINGDYYPLGGDSTIRMAEKIKEREEDTVDIFRAETVKYNTLNDNALIGYNGVSMFSSMVNASFTEYMEKFGICGWIASNRYTYQESSPFTNLMLNIKYLIIPYGSAHFDRTNMTAVAGREDKSDNETGYASLLQNNYYLPMGFLVKEDLLNYDVSTLAASQPIQNQNLFFRLATGLDGDLYEYFDAADSGSSTTVQAVAPRDGVAVAYVKPASSSSTYVTVKNGSRTISQVNIQRPYIMMLGTVTQGETLSVSTSSSTALSGSFAMFNEDLFIKGYNLFSRSTLHATSVSDTSIRGSINAVEDGLFYTSIPYTKGWKAYVDGEEVEITPLGDALVTFKLSKGQHTVELEYQPEGYPLGLIITIMGLVILIAMCILSWRKINLIDMALEKIKKGKKPRPALAAAGTAAGAVEAPAASAPPEETDTAPLSEEESETESIDSLLSRLSDDGGDSEGDPDAGDEPQS